MIRERIFGITRVCVGVAALHVSAYPCVANGPPSVVLEVATTSRGSFLLGLPVPITVRVSNKGDGGEVDVPRLAFGNSPLIARTIEVQVKKADDASFKTIRYPLPNFLTYEGVVPRVEVSRLNPGTTMSLSADLVLSWRFGDGSEDLIFPERGSFELRVAYFARAKERADGGLELDPRARTLSNIVKVVIEDGPDLRARQAWSALQRVERWWLVYEPRPYAFAPDVYRQSATQIRAFSQQFHETKYAELAQLALGYVDFVDARAQSDLESMARAIEATRNLAELDEFPLKTTAGDLVPEMRKQLQALKSE